MNEGSVGTCKPNSVRHFCRGDHSSRRRVAVPLQRPTRTLGEPSRLAEAEACASSLLRPYLVLLRVGFAMQRSLLNARCALTAPFHPYLWAPGKPVFGLLGERRYLFCGTFRRTALKPPLPGVTRHTALWSSDFPPPAPHSPARAGVSCAGGDRPIPTLSCSIIPPFDPTSAKGGQIWGTLPHRVSGRGAHIC